VSKGSKAVAEPSSADGENLGAPVRLARLEDDDDDEDEGGNDDEAAAPGIEAPGTEVVAPSPVAHGEKGAAEAATVEGTGVDDGGGGAAAPVRLANEDEEGD